MAQSSKNDTNSSGSKCKKLISSQRTLIITANTFIFIAVIFQLLLANNVLLMMVQCNPIAYNQLGAAIPFIAYAPPPIGAYHPVSGGAGAAGGATIMMTGGQFDPYSSAASFATAASPYFLPASAAYGMSAPMWSSGGGGATSMNELDSAASRRSALHRGGTERAGASYRSRSSSRNHNSNKDQQEQEPTDEQKALDGLPLSFIEPDPPATITERISESFSALGEGVKNHFRSISENFSDTLDDIKDAWRPASGGGGGSSGGDDGGSKRRRS